MTYFKRILENKHIAIEYLAAICGVKVKEIEEWLNTGNIPELYAPTLANLLEVDIAHLYSKDPEFITTSSISLDMPKEVKIEMNKDVGTL